MNSLAYTPPKEDRDKAPTPVSEDESPRYPSLRFNGEQAAEGGLSGCEYAEEYELTIRVKATRIDGSMTYPGSGDSKEKPAIEFDVLACDPPKPVKKTENERGPKVKGPKEAGIRSFWNKEKE